jgi:hypothetical protein
MDVTVTFCGKRGEDAAADNFRGQLREIEQQFSVL